MFRLGYRFLGQGRDNSAGKQVTMIVQSIPLITVVGKIKQTKLYRGLPGLQRLPRKHPLDTRE